MRRRRLGQSSFELHRVQTCALLCSRFQCFNSYPHQNPKTKTTKVQGGTTNTEVSGLRMLFSDFSFMVKLLATSLTKAVCHLFECLSTLTPYQSPRLHDYKYTTYISAFDSIHYCLLQGSCKEHHHNLVIAKQASQTIRRQ